MRTLQAVNLRPWRRNEPITAARLNAIQAAIPTLRAGKGIALRRSSTGQVIVELDSSLPRPKQTFWARVQSAATQTPNVWLYTMAEIVKAAAGSGGWVVRPGGRVVTARNLYEEGGVWSSALGGAALLPVPTGLPMLVTVVRPEDATPEEHWFGHPNPVNCQASQQAAQQAAQTIAPIGPPLAAPGVPR